MDKNGKNLVWNPLFRPPTPPPPKQDKTLEPNLKNKKVRFNSEVEELGPATGSSEVPDPEVEIVGYVGLEPPHFQIPLQLETFVGPALDPASSGQPNEQVGDAEDSDLDVEGLGSPQKCVGLEPQSSGQTTERIGVDISDLTPELEEVGIFLNKAPISRPIKKRKRKDTPLMYSQQQMSDYSQQNLPSSSSLQTPWDSQQQQQIPDFSVQLPGYPQLRFASPRPTAGTSRQTAGTSRQTAGTSRQTAGTSRQTAGTSRQTTGTSRPTAGTSRQTTGTSRPTAGTSRQTAGISRPTAGTSWQNAGSSWQNAGTSWQNAGTSWQNAGSSRQTAKAPTNLTAAPVKRGRKPLTKNTRPKLKLRLPTRPRRPRLPHHITWDSFDDIWNSAKVADYDPNTFEKLTPGKWNESYGPRPVNKEVPGRKLKDVPQWVIDNFPEAFEVQIREAGIEKAQVKGQSRATTV